MPYTMDERIRRSPSGPLLGSSNNGGTTRIAEDTVIITQGLVPTNPGVIGAVVDSLPALVVLLDNPIPDAFYRGTILVDFLNPSITVPGRVNLYLQSSLDDTDVWTDVAANTHIGDPAPSNLAGSAVVGVGRQIRLDLPVTLGEDLGVTPATTKLSLRARVSTLGTAADITGNVYTLVSLTTVGSAISTGSCLLQLQEIAPAV